MLFIKEILFECKINLLSISTSFGLMITGVTLESISKTLSPIVISVLCESALSISVLITDEYNSGRILSNFNLTESGVEILT